MKKVLFFLITFVIFYTHWTIYKRGLHDGEWNYKRSHKIYLAFKSAYLFGYSDCKEGKKEDWDRGEE
jgi:hypothetical protein